MILSTAFTITPGNYAMQRDQLRAVERCRNTQVPIAVNVFR